MSKPLPSPLQGALQFIRNTFRDPKVIRLENELKQLKEVEADLKRETYARMTLQDQNVFYMKANRVLRDENKCIKSELANHKVAFELAKELSQADSKEIEALKAIVSNLRKEKRYSGQKYYNPKDHKAETIYLCARWNDYYMISIGAYNVPNIITAAEFTERYGHYEIMPRMNRNQKNLS